MKNNYTASGKGTSSHWREDDEMAHIEDDWRVGELLGDDIVAEEVYTDLEASGCDVSFDEAMEQTRRDWQLERELVRNFNSDIMPGLR